MAEAPTEEKKPATPAQMACGCGCLLLIAAIVVLVGLGFWRVATHESSPVEKAVMAAESKIAVYDQNTKAIGFGNTPEAAQIATDFAKNLRAIDKKLFTGGSKVNMSILSGKEFLTYLELRDDKLCFLVHVPQLKEYKDEVRRVLLDLAWNLAVEETKDLRREKDRKLCVALKGTLFYGGMAIGMGNGEPERKLDALVSEKPLREFFEPVGGVAPVASESR